MSSKNQNPFDAFVEQAVLGAKNPEALRDAAARMIAQMAPQDYVKFLLGFLYDTQFSRNSITGLLCLPFMQGDDGHDYPTEPFIFGSPGPLNDIDMMGIGASAITAYVNSHCQDN